MQTDLFVPTWRKAGVVVAFLIIAAGATTWAKSTIFVSRSATAAASAAGPASSAWISPMDIMRTHGKDLPSADYVEPF